MLSGRMKERVTRLCSVGRTRRKCSSAVVVRALRKRFEDRDDEVEEELENVMDMSDGLRALSVEELLVVAHAQVNEDEQLARGRLVRARLPECTSDARLWRGRARACDAAKR